MALRIELRVLHVVMNCSTADLDAQASGFNTWFIVIQQLMMSYMKVCGNGSVTSYFRLRIPTRNI